MKTKLLVAGLFVLGMALVPGVAAEHVDESDESVDAGDQGTYYLVVGEDSVELWEETNDHAGLQTEVTQVGGEDLDPDTQVLPGGL